MAPLAALAGGLLILVAFPAQVATSVLVGMLPSEVTVELAALGACVAAAVSALARCCCLPPCGAVGGQDTTAGASPGAAWVIATLLVVEGACAVRLDRDVYMNTAVFLPIVAAPVACCCSARRRRFGGGGGGAVLALIASALAAAGTGAAKSALRVARGDRPTAITAAACAATAALQPVAAQMALTAPGARGLALAGAVVRRVGLVVALIVAVRLVLRAAVEDEDPTSMALSVAASVRVTDALPAAEQALLVEGDAACLRLPLAVLQRYCWDPRQAGLPACVRVGIEGLQFCPRPRALLGVAASVGVAAAAAGVAGLRLVVVGALGALSDTTVMLLSRLCVLLLSAQGVIIAGDKSPASSLSPLQWSLCTAAATAAAAQLITAVSARDDPTPKDLGRGASSSSSTAAADGEPLLGDRPRLGTVMDGEAASFEAFQRWREVRDMFEFGEFVNRRRGNGKGSPSRFEEVEELVIHPPPRRAVKPLR